MAPLSISLSEFVADTGIRIADPDHQLVWRLLPENHEAAGTAVLPAVLSDLEAPPLLMFVERPRAREGFEATLSVAGGILPRVRVVRHANGSVRRDGYRRSRARVGSARQGPERPISRNPGTDEILY